MSSNTIVYLFVILCNPNKNFEQLLFFDDGGGADQINCIVGAFRTIQYVKTLCIVFQGVVVDPNRVFGVFRGKVVVT